MLEFAQYLGFLLRTVIATEEVATGPCNLGLEALSTSFDSFHFDTAPQAVSNTCSGYLRLLRPIIDVFTNPLFYRYVVPGQGFR